MSYPVIRLHEIQGALGRRNRLDFGTVWPRVQIPGPDQIRIQSHPAGGFNVTSPVVVVNPPTGDFAVLADVVEVSRLQSVLRTVGSGNGRCRPGSGGKVTESEGVRRGSREQRVGACTDQESERYRGHGGTLAHGVENDDMAGQLQTREARLPEGAGRCPTGGRESLGAGLPELGAGRSGRAGKELAG